MTQNIKTADEFFERGRDIARIAVRQEIIVSREYDAVSGPNAGCSPRSNKKG